MACSSCSLEERDVAAGGQKKEGGAEGEKIKEWKEYLPSTYCEAVVFVVEVQISVNDRERKSVRYIMYVSDGAEWAVR